MILKHDTTVNATLSNLDNIIPALIIEICVIIATAAKKNPLEFPRGTKG